jgi:hypothetical protein
MEIRRSSLAEEHCVVVCKAAVTAQHHFDHCRRGEVGFDSGFSVSDRTHHLFSDTTVHNSSAIRRAVGCAHLLEQEGTWVGTGE